jgi:hypothetical protein
MAEDSDIISKGIKFLGEYMIPGTSLILDGRTGAGLLHTGLAIAATAWLGPVGPVVRGLIAINSFSESTSDRNLWDFRGPRAARAPAAARSSS